MNKVKQARTWSLVVYNYDAFDLMIQLSTIESLVHYAYIVHSKDVQENGEVKKEHIHLLVNLSVPVTLKWLERRLYTFNSLEGTLIGEPVTDKRMCFRYLTHKDDKDKYQYNDNEVLSNDLYYWTSDLKDKTSDVLEMIDDITKRTSLRTLAKKYGKDFMKNYRSYIEFASNVVYQETGETFIYFKTEDKK